jgi:hypothetical protein
MKNDAKSSCLGEHVRTAAVYKSSISLPQPTINANSCRVFPDPSRPKQFRAKERHSICYGVVFCD